MTTLAGGADVDIIGGDPGDRLDWDEGLRFAEAQEATGPDLREGRFLERIAPGAFARTIREDRSRMRILLSHGTDPHIGDKPLAPLDILLEQPERGGAYYGGQMFDTSYNRDLVPPLRAGQFG